MVVDSRFFSEQTRHPSALSEIAPAADTGLESILSNTNQRLIDPLNLTVSGSNLVLSIGAAVVTSGPSGKQRGIPQVNGVDVGNISGSFDFSGGAVTGAAVTEALPNMTAGYYIRAGVEVRSDAKIYIVFGDEGDSPSSAGAPAFSRGSLPRGEILLHDDGTGGQGNFVTPTMASILQFGSGAGGGGGTGAGLGNINYVKNYDFDVSMNEWETYNDGSANPVDGTSGTVDPGFTLTQEEGSVLRGDGSALITKPASDVIGHGISTLLGPIAPADQGRLLEISFDYEISGNYAGDFGVWLYDTVGASLITPHGSNIMPYGKGRVRMQFACPAGASDLRLMVHVRSSSAEAMTVKLDLVSVGPVFETETIKKNIHQVSAHGLSAGDIVWFTGSTWAKAAATDAVFQEDYQAGMVLETIDSHNFVLLERGYFRLPVGTNLTPGGTYYLSETAGEYTEDTSAEILLPLFQATGQHEGIFGAGTPRRLHIDPVVPFSFLRFVSPGYTVAHLKGGEIRLDSGEVIVSGNGATEAGVGVPLDVDFSVLLGGAPANDTAYWLYIDRYALTETALTDSGRTVLRAYEDGHFYLSTTPPDEINPFRYILAGMYHSATAGTAWEGAGAQRVGVPSRIHSTTYSMMSVPQKNSLEFTSAVNGDYSHGLEGAPHSINAFYYDGTTESPIEVSTVVSKRGESVLGIDTSAYTFGSGEKVTVDVMFFPTLNKNLSSVAGRLDSGWITSSIASIAHNLSDALDIAGISVLEHNTSTDRYRVLVGSASPVVNHDDSNVYLDWTGFAFTNLRYRVLSGGSPVPQAVPTYMGGFTKFVGFGPGTYATLAAAIADSQPGDSILVSRDESLTSPVDVDVDNIRVRFMPDVKFTFTSGSKGFILSGDGITIENPWAVMAIAGAATAGLEISGVENFVEQARVEANDASLVLAAAYSFLGSAARNWVNGVVRSTVGTVTSTLTDVGTDNSGYVRG